MDALAARLRSTPLDLVLALAFVLVGLAQTFVLPIAGGGVGQLFVLGTTLPLAWRRTHAVEAAAVSSAFWLIPTEGYPVLGFVVAVLLYFSLGAYGAPRTGVAVATAWGLLTSVVGTLLGPEQPVAAIGAALVVLAPVLAGLLVAHQRAQNQALQAVTRELAAEREKVRESAVAAERSRIAHELHDVLGHELTLIAIQAEAATTALELAPERVGAPIEAVRTTAHRALDEMRAVLDLLDTPSDGVAVPGRAALAQVVEQAAAAGVPARLSVTGTPWEAQPAVWLALVRVVRECLTNAGRHAPGQPVDVALDWRDDEVDLRVVNPLARSTSTTSGGGRGLVGVAHRAQLLGGRCTSGETSEGFVVNLALPRAVREPA